MSIRHIEQHQVQDFIQRYDDPGAQNWIKRLFETQETKTEWCFVIEENDTHLGQIIYFQFAGNDSELNIFGLTLPWEGRYVEIGVQLLEESLAHVKTLAIEKIEFRCDSDEPHHQKALAVIESAGFELVQDKYRYILTDLKPSPHYDHALVFKTLDEVGEAQFIEAIQQVTVSTLDRVDQSDVDHMGAEAAAREYFNILQSIDDNPAHWVLAYDADQHLIGLVVAQTLSSATGCINYIGVVPEHRGHNYSKTLALKVTELLAHIETVERIIAEIDVDNVPLERTLTALHYQKAKTMWVYHKRDFQPFKKETNQ